jgi:hypothetical protein
MKASTRGVLITYLTQVNELEARWDERLVIDLYVVCYEVDHEHRPVPDTYHHGNFQGEVRLELAHYQYFAEDDLTLHPALECKCPLAGELVAFLASGVR